jgi:hypothetical protein
VSCFRPSDFLAPLMTCAVAISLSAAHAAPVDFTVQGVVTNASDLNPYSVFIGDSVVATGSFDDSLISTYGSSYIRFGAGTAQFITLHLGEVSLAGESATGFADGYLPVLRFHNGVPVSIAFEAAAGEAGSPVTFTSAGADFGGPDIDGSWDFSSFASSSQNLELIEVQMHSGETHAVVQDWRTGLMWMQDASGGGLRTWEDAKQWAADLDYAGHSDWRLPSTLVPDPACSSAQTPQGQNCESEMGNLAHYEGITHNTPRLFLNVVPYSPGYWSGTAHAETDSPYSTYIFTHSFGDNYLIQQIIREAGTTHAGDSTNYRYVNAWAVRDAVSPDPDTDGDGILDSADNCVHDANPDQADYESDGLGDVCDPDDDNDGVDDDADIFPWSGLLPTLVFGDLDTGVPNIVLEDGAAFGDLIAEAAADARNHGQFVSSVTQFSNDWRRDGHISRTERSTLVTAVAGADRSEL